MQTSFSVFPNASLFIKLSLELLQCSFMSTISYSALFHFFHHVQNHISIYSGYELIGYWQSACRPSCSTNEPFADVALLLRLPSLASRSVLSRRLAERTLALNSVPARFLSFPLRPPSRQLEANLINTKIAPIAPDSSRVSNTPLVLVRKLYEYHTNR